MEGTKDEVVTVVRAAGCMAYYEEFENRQLKCQDCLLFGVHCFGCSHKPLYIIATTIYTTPVT